MYMRQGRPDECRPRFGHADNTHHLHLHIHSVSSIDLPPGRRDFCVSFTWTERHTGSLAPWRCRKTILGSPSSFSILPSPDLSQHCHGSVMRSIIAGCCSARETAADRRSHPSADLTAGIGDSAPPCGRKLCTLSSQRKLQKVPEGPSGSPGS